MKITEGQLRRIIRQEVRSLHETLDLDTPISQAAQDVVQVMRSGLQPGSLRALVGRVAADYGIDAEGVEEHLRALGRSRLIDRAHSAMIARELAV